MKITVFLFSFFLVCTFLSNAQTHTFLNVNGDSNWHNPANWSANSVPDATSTVSIPDGFEAIVSAQNAFAQTITLEGAAILELNNLLQLANQIDISPVANLKLKNGHITGGIINNEGFIKITESLPKKITQVTINNNKSIIIQDSGVLNLSQVTINNATDAIFEIIGNSGLINNDADTQFNNFGLFKKSYNGTNIGNSYVILNFVNNGVIDLDTEEILLFLSPLSSLYNTNTGIIQGTGTLDITGNFINEGTISPGGDEIGTLDFVNKFTTSDASILRIDIDGTSGESDLIHFIGGGPITGNIFIPTPLTPVNIDDQFTFFTAQLGIDSCNLPVEVSSNDGSINDIIFTVFCQTNSVMLEVEAILLDTPQQKANELFTLIGNPVASTAEILVTPNLLSENVTLSIVDGSGKQLLIQNISEEKTSINTSALSSGIYIIQTTSNSQKQTEKLVVQH